MDLVDAVRWVNVGLGTIGLLWLGARSVLRWGAYPHTLRLFTLTLSFFVFGVVYGSAEAAVQYAPVGARAFIFLVGTLAFMVTLAVTQRRPPAA